MCRHSPSTFVAAAVAAVVAVLPAAHAQEQVEGTGRTAFEFSRNVETCDTTEGADLPLVGTTRVRA